MRLPRKHKVFRGQLDVAPFAGLFFLMVIFLVFHSGLVLTPGIPLKLPSAYGMVGLTNQSIVVAVTANGNCYYENQIITDNELKTRLRAAQPNRRPLTLVLQTDRDLRHERLVELCVLARDAGIQETLLAVRPELRPAAVDPVVTP